MTSFEKIKRNLDIIYENIDKLHLKRPIDIIGVTKTIDPSEVNFAIQHGITLLGENKSQELCAKYSEYSLDAPNIHFIGHLQKNKVKYIIDKVGMIESVDSIALVQTLDRYARGSKKVMDILIEVNVSGSLNKQGVAFDQAIELIHQASDYQNVRVKGLMCIPGKEHYVKQFEKIYHLFIDIQSKKMDNINMEILSMGMSMDYLEAIQCGSNHIRLGKAIFDTSS